MKIYILSLLAALVLSSTVKSECEQTENPTGLKDCKGKKTEDPKTETCCYVKSQNFIKEGQTDYTCIDVTAEDVKTPEGKAEVIRKIENGIYWEGYEEKGKILDLQCGAEFLYPLMVMALGLLF